jgi:hypothetical protein
MRGSGNNLRLRPHAPNAGRGRLQRQIRRAFAGRPLLTSSQVYDSCYVKRRVFGERIPQRHRHSVTRTARTTPYSAVSGISAASMKFDAAPASTVVLGVALPQQAGEPSHR